MLAPQRQHLPLYHGALNVVILQHDVLLQALDGVVTPGGLELGQQDFAEAGRMRHN